jgi:hypothetical protein
MSSGLQAMVALVRKEEEKESERRRRWEEESVSA